MSLISGEHVDIVRVARSGDSIIAKRPGDVDSYVVVKRGEFGEYAAVAQSESLEPLVASGGWRRAIAGDNEKYTVELAVAAGAVIASAPEPAERTYRVPPTVKRQIAEALEAYSSILPDEDREKATRLATRTAVSKTDIEWIHRFFANTEKARSLHGGRNGQAWAEKVLGSADDEVLTASAFTADPNLVYFAGGPDQNDDVVDALYAVNFDNEGDGLHDDELYTWQDGDFQYTGTTDDLDRPLLVQIDPDTAAQLADWLDAHTGMPATEDSEDGETEPDGDAESPEEDANEPGEEEDDYSYYSGKNDGLFRLSSIDPEEANLFALAESEIDWEMLDRVATVIADATGYSGPERSNNANRQPRAVGGKFSGPPAPTGDTLSTAGFAKARFSGTLPLTDNINGVITVYFDGLTDDSNDNTGSPVTAAGADGVTISASEPPRQVPADSPDQAPPAADTPGPADTMAEGAKPLYVAIVDETDQSAVLDVVAVAQDANGQPGAWVRSGGKWVYAADKLDDLRGVTPPPTVVLSDEATLKDVLAQVDQHDAGTPAGDGESMAASAYELAATTRVGRERAAKKGLALPDGSFPIATVADLKNAIKAYGRAKNKAAARRHIRKRARALGRTDLVPADWKSMSQLDELFDDSHLSTLYGPYGEVIAQVAAGVPGVSDTPQDEKNVERLREYWLNGKGAAKIRWGTKGDLSRCHREVEKYMPGHGWGYCQNLHERKFGMSNAKHDKITGQDK